MLKIKKLVAKMMERIRKLFNFTQENIIKAWEYEIVLMISLIIDKMYCNRLTEFYGTEDYFLSHMRGTLTIGVSLIFGIIDLCLAYYIYIYAKKILLIINFINGKFAGVEGTSKLVLIPLGVYFMMISVISIAYDVYEVIFVHILGRVL